MPMPPCKDHCEKDNFPYKTMKKPKYTDGFNFCQSCRRSIKTESIKCPCCGCDLRRKPRHGKLKKEMMLMVKRY